MPMKKLTIICLIILLVTSCKHISTVDDLTVTAEFIPTGNIASYNCNMNGFDDYYYNRLVKIRVKNNLQTPKSFWIMSCGWEESFRCDNKDFSFSYGDCEKNVPKEIIVIPYHTITFKGIIRQKQQSWYANDSNTFRIGLILFDEKDLLSSDKIFNPKFRENKKTYWSNPITIYRGNIGYDWKK
jgi:hypothetical protein